MKNRNKKEKRSSKEFKGVQSSEPDFQEKGKEEKRSEKLKRPRGFSAPKVTLASSTYTETKSSMSFPGGRCEWWSYQMLSNVVKVIMCSFYEFDRLGDRVPSP